MISKKKKEEKRKERERKRNHSVWKDKELNETSGFSFALPT